MKNYLLDTQVFIKGFQQPELLPKKVIKLLEDPRSIKYVSSVSFWEMAYLLDTKPHIFKIKVPLSTFINEAVQSLQIVVLNLTAEHSQRFYEIQPIKDHKDIYDRMLIAQAASTGFTMVSTDRNFPLYPIRLFDFD
ncbi:type II toxin-antitoxin system VapC family toxin [Runella zeae]|uniref:type II toxin-antitoxin system VapC family toxin n=1 Tax=Runella zeae TaxID=94255 RepID=UPI00041EAEDB|nr:type II toxin-antitoxin system VapC family toxin [Runella zeae]